MLTVLLFFKLHMQVNSKQNSWTKYFENILKINKLFGWHSQIAGHTNTHWPLYNSKIFSVVKLVSFNKCLIHRLDTRNNCSITVLQDPSVYLSILKCVKGFQSRYCWYTSLQHFEVCSSTSSDQVGFLYGMVDP